MLYRQRLLAASLAVTTTLLCGWAATLTTQQKHIGNYSSNGYTLTAYSSPAKSSASDKKPKPPPKPKPKPKAAPKSHKKGK